MVDLLEIEQEISAAIVAAIAPLVSEGIDIAVLRYPQRPLQGQGQGDAGRPAAIYLGFSSLTREPSADETPRHSHAKKISKIFSLEYNFVFESYEYRDPDIALLALTQLTQLEGVVLYLKGVPQPLEFDVSFVSHENGYWLYEGEIRLILTQNLAVTLAPGLTDETRVDNFSVGLYSQEIGSINPLDKSRGTLDQTIEIRK